MKYIDSIKTDGIQISSKIPQKLELGDLTIFIGKSNAGKTRILNFLRDKINSVIKNITKENFLEQLQNKGIDVNKKIPIPFRVVLNPKERNIIQSFPARGALLSRTNNSLKLLDDTIEDLGNGDIEFSEQIVRKLQEQGSGVHSLLNIAQHIFKNDFHFILLDEPENSLFPYGKIELLKQLIAETKQKKQIIIATHDPTFINNYLIKKNINGKEIDVKIYSCTNNEFKKVDFESKKIVSEIHAGYLSQTYSGKPVHLFLEGQTDYYVFQALLPKFCIMKKVPNFSYILSRIAMYYMGGGQWHNHIGHLPDNRYFRVSMLLDGEYTQEINKLDDTKYHIINDDSNFVKEKTNILSFKKENIEEVFKGIFGDSFEKPYELAEIIWKITQEDFELIWNKNESDSDIKKITKILNWAIKQAQTE